MLGLVARLVLVDWVPLILNRFACIVTFVCICEVWTVIKLISEGGCSSGDFVAQNF